MTAKWGVVLSGKRGLIKSLANRHDLTFNSNSIHSIWELAQNVFMLTSNGVANKKKIDFSAILKPVLKFLYQNKKYSCVFFTFHRAMFSRCITMHKLICHHLRQCPVGFCPGRVNSTAMFCWCWGKSCCHDGVGRLWVGHACAHPNEYGVLSSTQNICEWSEWDPFQINIAGSLAQNSMELFGSVVACLV